MKPFTVEELKEKFNVDDWVYIVDNARTPNGFYYQVYDNNAERLRVMEFGFIVQKLNYSYDDYGTRWLAYKNKEQAEDDYQTTMDGYLTQFGHNTLRGKKFIEAAESRISKEVAKDILQVVSGIDETFKCRK